MTLGQKFRDFMRHKPVEQQRYETLLASLGALVDLFRGRRVLDFGASYALSMCALLELGAASVRGIEPDGERVKQGQEILSALGHDGAATLEHVSDTARLSFPDNAFDVVLANAVLEHIPQPRGAYVREMWRVLAPGGHLIVNETPNKYFPVDVHTTGLWFVPWLPRDVAHRYALWRGRFSPTAHWASSGWRGLGFYEMVGALETPYEYIPERSRWRHRVLTRLGLPASLVDPYPTWILRKPNTTQAPKGK